MKSPKQYTIRKFKLQQFIETNGNLNISDEEANRYNIKQGDNPLFRQIRIITKTESEFNPYVIFLDCKGYGVKTKYEKENKVKIGEKERILRDFLENGIIINGIKFLMTEKSASMSRNSIIGFIDSRIKDKIDKIITMDMPVTKTVLAKLLAYRGLFFSGCFCLEDILPRIVIVDDVSRTIPQQNIKHMIDIEKECVNKDGERYIWKEKGIKEDIIDVDINLWDGSGIISNEFCDLINEKLEIDYGTSFIIRMPYFKGMVHKLDYKRWFKEHNVSTITDIWGKTHDIEDTDMIVTKSFYKGYKYFKINGDYSDWEYYIQKFKEYNHCFGITAWNYSFEDEPIYTRASYQILQDLDIPFDEFIKLADYSKEWIDKIINGDSVYTNCFLGLLHDNHKASNDYMKALLKDQQMLKEEAIRNYILGLIRKKIDEMKCGKLYLKGSFKFIVIDLIMFLRYISGMDIKGELKSNEFYAIDKDGAIEGKRIIERNPHITSSEHCILEGTHTDLLQEYCGHLSNVFMCNGYSITLPRLNGCDEDGDRVFVIDSDVMQRGIHTSSSVVLDMEDKATVSEKEINIKNIIDCTIDSMVSLVGEFSNYASCYHNKQAMNKEQKDKYLNNIDILSIATGKSIDYAKTGVLFMPPYNIQKYAKPFPYFMKYTGDYYSNMKSLSKAHSNMNLLAFDIEKVHKNYRFTRKYQDFDYTIMLAEIEIDDVEVKLNKLNQIFKEYNKDMQLLKKAKLKNEDVDWDKHYNKYKSLVREVESNESKLANLLIKLCYEVNPKKDKKFAWLMNGNGIVNNIKQQDIMLPLRDDNGDIEYLGRKYKLEKVEI